MTTRVGLLPFYKVLQCFSIAILEVSPPIYLLSLHIRSCNTASYCVRSTRIQEQLLDLGITCETGVATSTCWYQNENSTEHMLCAGQHSTGSAAAGNTVTPLSALKTHRRSHELFPIYLTPCPVGSQFATGQMGNTFLSSERCISPVIYGEEAAEKDHFFFFFHFTQTP